MLHVISLAQFALAYTRGWAVNSQVARMRLKAENDRLRRQVAWLTEEIRIKDARMRRIPALARPHYLPTDLVSPPRKACDEGYWKELNRRSLILYGESLAAVLADEVARGLDPTKRVAMAFSPP